MTNKERLEANNAKIEEITKILKNKMLPSNEGDYFVRVIDYDGTILKETRLNSGETFTIPTPPTHDGLVFQEWSCSQDIVDGMITIEDNNVMVGAVYTTASGLCEFDIELTKATGLDVTFNMDGTKDWGDGTSDDLTTHTYSAYGNYTIKCNGTRISSSSSAGLFGQDKNNPNYFCINARLANLATLATYSFYRCYSLKSITIPNTVIYMFESSLCGAFSLLGIVIPPSVINIGDNAVNLSASLINIVVPNSVKTVESFAFYNNYSLIDFILPNSIISGLGQVVRECYSLKSVNIPNSIKGLGDYTFADCYSLKNMFIPSSVVDIRSNVFKNCYYLLKYDFSTHLQVPTLTNANTFSGINKLAKIIVPDNLYDEWIVSTNWSTYADYIYKSSEVQ